MNIFIKKFSSISLQYKLLALLVLLPVSCITAYLVLVTNLFEEDKKAYVHDSSLSLARSTSGQVRSELTSIEHEIETIVAGLDRQTGNFDTISQKVFKKKRRIKSVGIYLVNSKSKEFEKKAHLGSKDSFTQKTRLIKRTSDHKKYFLKSKKEGHIWIGLKFQSPLQDKHYVVISHVNAYSVMGQFINPGLYRAFLVDGRGQIILSPLKGIELTSYKTWNFLKKISSSKLGEGTTNVKSPMDTELFVSYSKTHFGPFYALTILEKSEALKAVDMMIKKSLLFFISLVSLSVLVSFFSSRKITESLRELSKATDKVSSGDFDIQVPIRSYDEVGELGESFNLMGAKISQLMKETAQKARMEQELQTAQLVQKTLFPKLTSSKDGVSLAGHYTPASECGGDWWSYEWNDDGKLWLWIGDATGHGAPAALITSAAKSASGLISKLPGITPAKAMKMMNQAVCDTGGGEICMTFFIGLYCPHTNKLTYSIAGHEPPLLFKGPGELSKKSALPLNEVNGKRLGDDPREEYQEESISIGQNQHILFYTDGVTDLENPEGQKWSERRMLKSIANGLNHSDGPEKAVELFTNDLQEFRDGHELLDDVTFFLVSFKSGLPKEKKEKIDDDLNLEVPPLPLSKGEDAA